MIINKLRWHMYETCLVCSVLINILLSILYVGSGGGRLDLTWTKTAAKEAEGVAAVQCSGHGRAYLDGLVIDHDDRGTGNLPTCECNACYGGHDCSLLFTNCTANLDSGDPLFLEPFWMQNAANSALVVAGWHRMSYRFTDESLISGELEKCIRKVHAIVGNAVTDERYILFGAGSSQLLIAAQYALSPPSSNSSLPAARVVNKVPYYPLYEVQTMVLNSANKFEGDASLWKNVSDTNIQLIEFVTSPNNPDGLLNKAVINNSLYAKSIHDRAYYWPHFTGIPARADDDLMMFTISKLTGHAGSRFGWAIVKDKEVYERMVTYIAVNTMGVSHDAQLRALKLLKVVLEGKTRYLFEFGYRTMSSRWKKLSTTISMSKRFSLQQIPPENCTYFHTFREASPAYAWIKCESVNDGNCYEVMAAGHIKGREASLFGAEDRYVRLSMLSSQDDFDLMIHYLTKLVLEENGLKAT